VERNVFGLKPTPLVPPVEARGAPPPRITLTGITTILGDKRVLMKVEIPGRAGEPASERSVILAEGQRESNIEVLKVDVDTGDVTIDDFGSIVALNLEKDGTKLAPMSPRPNIAPPVGLIPPTPSLANTPIARPPSAQ
jgi:hypothetical protein